jgi:hypothetical protein
MNGLLWVDKTEVQSISCIRRFKYYYNVSRSQEEPDSTAVCVVERIGSGKHVNQGANRTLWASRSYKKATSRAPRKTRR